jgi:HlyD family secretion protein
VLVPNAALRFTPPVTKTTRRSGGGIFGAMFRRPSSNRRRTDGVDKVSQKVWILRDGQPTAVEVKTGASDGKFTELRSGDIQTGQQIIIDAFSVKK